MVIFSNFKPNQPTIIWQVSGICHLPYLSDKKQKIIKQWFSSLSLYLRSSLKKQTVGSHPPDFYSKGLRLWPEAHKTNSQVNATAADLGSIFWEPLFKVFLGIFVQEQWSWYALIWGFPYLQSGITVARVHEGRISKLVNPQKSTLWWHSQSCC